MRSYLSLSNFAVNCYKTMKKKKEKRKGKDERKTETITEQFF